MISPPPKTGVDIRRAAARGRLSSNQVPSIAGANFARIVPDDFCARNQTIRWKHLRARQCNLSALRDLNASASCQPFVTPDFLSSARPDTAVKDREALGIN
jgi:hypothetical protein